MATVLVGHAHNALLTSVDSFAEAYVALHK